MEGIFAGAFAWVTGIVVLQLFRHRAKHILPARHTLFLDTDVAAATNHSRSNCPDMQIVHGYGRPPQRQWIRRKKWSAFILPRQPDAKSAKHRRDAQEFIKKLNALNDGYTYRLPSEAEWEYACRAGTTGDYAGDQNSMGWYDANSNHKVHPVGQKQPNAWGLYDMYGNEEEWVMDNSDDNYNGAPTDGSAWLSGGDSNQRLSRGGSWDSLTNNLSSSFRNIMQMPDSRAISSGLRGVTVSRWCLYAL